MSDQSGEDRWSGYSGGRTWIQSDRPLARGIARPVRRFLHVETAGGIVLLIATVASLTLANTGWGDDIADFWHTELTLLDIGGFQLAEDLGHWVNDGLMVIFFLRGRPLRGRPGIR